MVSTTDMVLGISKTSKSPSKLTIRKSVIPTTINAAKTCTISFLISEKPNRSSLIPKNSNLIQASTIDKSLIRSLYPIAPPFHMLQVILEK